MRKQYLDVLEQGRITVGAMRSRHGDPFGAFNIRSEFDLLMQIIASDGIDPASNGWEHVSVSGKRRSPNWPEMCFVKDLFWYPDEAVVQFHPARKEYVNYHPHCLHLWKPPYPIIMPPSILVGPK